MKLEYKYLKIKSLTWWAGFVPMMAGAFIALEPVHGLDAWSNAIGSMFNDADPAILINSGLAVIGFRGAVSDA